MNKAVAKRKIKIKKRFGKETRKKHLVKSSISIFIMKTLQILLMENKKVRKIILNILQNLIVRESSPKKRKGSPNSSFMMSIRIKQQRLLLLVTKVQIKKMKISNILTTISWAALLNQKLIKVKGTNMNNSGLMTQIR